MFWRVKYYSLVNSNTLRNFFENRCFLSSCYCTFELVFVGGLTAFVAPFLCRGTEIGTPDRRVAAEIDVFVEFRLDACQACQLGVVGSSRCRNVLWFDLTGDFEVFGHLHVALTTILTQEVL